MTLFSSCVIKRWTNVSCFHMNRIFLSLPEASRHWLQLNVNRADCFHFIIYTFIVWLRGSFFFVPGYSFDVQIGTYTTHDSKYIQLRYMSSIVALFQTVNRFNEASSPAKLLFLPASNLDSNTRWFINISRLISLVIYAAEWGAYKLVAMMIPSFSLPQIHASAVFIASNSFNFISRLIPKRSFLSPFAEKRNWIKFRKIAECSQDTTTNDRLCFFYYFSFHDCEKLSVKWRLRRFNRWWNNSIRQFVISPAVLANFSFNFLSFNFYVLPRLRFFYATFNDEHFQRWW